MSFLRRHRWWLLPELLVIAAIATGLIMWRGNGFQDQLADRAQAELERLSPAQLELFPIGGHGLSPDAKVICAAEPFGTEPATAERIEDVQVIYARYLCALAQDGTPWDYASRSSGPAVIRLAAPAVVQIAQSGEGFPGRVQEMMPDDLEAQAFAGFADKGRPTSLLLRYNDEIS